MYVAPRGKQPYSPLVRTAEKEKLLTLCCAPHVLKSMVLYCRSFEIYPYNSLKLD